VSTHSEGLKQEVGWSYIVFGLWKRIKNMDEKADEIPPFELYVKKFSDNVVSPRFFPISKTKLDSYGKGITILKSHQCPYVYNLVNIIKEKAEKAHVQVRIKNISNCKEAQKNGVHPYGVFCVLLQGDDKACSYYTGDIREFNDFLKRD